MDNQSRKLKLRLLQKFEPNSRIYSRIFSILFIGLFIITRRLSKGVRQD